MGSLILTKENFDTEVMKSDLPVLVDFWAPWCGPCKMIAPVIEEIAAKVMEEGTAKVGKINVDEQPELASQFKVMSIPTLVVVKQGKVVSTSVGVKSKADILKLL